MSTGKWHINKKGIPAPCKAKPGNCPLGGDETHFKSQEDANKFINDKNFKEHGLLPTLDILNLKADSYVDKNGKKVLDNVEFYRNDERKFIDEDTLGFNETPITAAKRYLGQLIKHEEGNKDYRYLSNLKSYSWREELREHAQDIFEIAPHSYDHEIEYVVSEEDFKLMDDYEYEYYNIQKDIDNFVDKAKRADWETDTESSLSNQENVLSAMKALYDKI